MYDLNALEERLRVEWRIFDASSTFFNQRAYLPISYGMGLLLRALSTRSIFFAAFAAIYGLGGALAYAGPSKEDLARIFEQIPEVYGPLVPREAAPDTYKLLDEIILERLNPALRAFAKVTFPLHAEVHVINRSSPNAFVLPLAEKEGGKTNIVFITTGLIAKLGKDRSSGEAAELIAGVLLHEMAHPADSMSLYSIEKQWGEASSRQLTELRADAESIQLAKLSRLSTDALYRAGLAMDEGKPPEAEAPSQSIHVSAIENGLGSHPEGELRDTSLRIFMTFDEFEHGTSPVSPLKNRDGRFVAEINALPPALPGRLAYPKTETLLENLDHLEQYIGKPVKNTKEEFRFNALLWELNQKLLKRGSNLSKEESDRLLKFNISLMEATRPKIVSKTVGYMDARRDFLATFDGKTQEELVPEIAAYRFKEYQVRIINHYRDALLQQKGKVSIGELLQQYSLVLPSDVLFLESKQALIEEMKTWATSDPTDPAADMMEKLSSENQVRLAAIFHDEVLPKLTLEERVLFFRRNGLLAGKGGYTPFFLRYQWDRDLDKAREAKSIPDAKTLPELRSSYKALALRIWKDRGEYAALDASLRNAWHVDWEKIFSEVGLSKDQGYAELRESVRVYTASQRFYDLLKSLKKLDPKFNTEDSQKPKWLTPELSQALSGTKNAFIAKDPEIAEFADKKWAKRMTLLDPKENHQNVKTALVRYLNTLSAKPLVTDNFRIRKGILPEKSEITDLAFAEAVSESGLSEADKSRLLHEIFVSDWAHSSFTIFERYDSNGSTFYTRLDDQPEVAHQILALLKKHGAVGSSSDLLHQVYSPVSKDLNSGYRWHPTGVGVFEDQLHRELDALASKGYQELLKFIAVVLDPGAGEYMDQRVYKEYQSAAFQRLRDHAAQLLGRLQIALPEKIAAFDRLTETGRSQGTDRYFAEQLRKAPWSHPQYRDDASRFLVKERLGDRVLEIELAKQVLEPQVIELQKAALTPDRLKKFFKELNKHAPSSSIEKDRFVEDLAWRLKIEDVEMLSLIEGEKSLSWTKHNPNLVKWVSFASTYLRDMRPHERLAAMDYVLDPQGKNVPTELMDVIDRNVRAGRISGVGVGPGAEAKARYYGKVSLEQYATQLKDIEKVPILDLLINAKPDPIVGGKDYALNLARRFLRYEPGSGEEIVLSAFLSVLPEYRRTVALAYLMSVSGKDKTGVKAIFEAFKAVGVKTGQQASLWRLMGDAYLGQLGELKDSASPPVKKEIRELIEKNLSPQELGKIKHLKEIKGSASIKTAVLVELADGREVIMYVRRPNAEQQIRSNLALARKLIEELERRGQGKQVGLMKELLSPIEEQLQAELKMTEEARHIQRAKEFYARMNKELAANLDGWRLEVPGISKDFQVRDELLFVDAVQAKSFRHLTESEARGKMGQAIVDSALKALFEEGWLNADPHVGNFLIDPKAKVLYPIDFGQTEVFSKKASKWAADDVYVFAQFLRSLEAKDAQGVLSYGLSMGEAPHNKLGMIDKALLLRELEGALGAKEGMNETLIKVVNLFGSSKRPFQRKFLLGGLKMLQTLAAEGYVSPDALKAKVAAHVKAALLAKAPRAALDVASGTCRLRGVLQGLR